MTQESQLVAPDGRPARASVTASPNCPRCGAGEERRTKSGGFGETHDVCQECGFEGFERSAR